MFKFRKETRAQVSLLFQRFDDLVRRIGYVPYSSDLVFSRPESVDEKIRNLRNDVEAIIEHLGLEHVRQTVTPPHLRKKTRRAIRKG